MIFTATALPGPVIVDIERHHDSRGFFARTFARKDFADAGLEPLVEQCSLSFNAAAGTVRGMHYQAEPATEAKLVRCTSGAILDVVVDVRPGSPTFLSHVAVELTATSRRALYVPAHFAHGFQTLTDDTEVAYQISEAHTPGAERGLRYDDPRLKIAWPLPVSAISEKDAAWALLDAGTDERLLDE